MRLNIYVSSTGLCSRRAADRMIESGRVKVNGKVSELGYIVKEGDQVEANGKIISFDDKAEKVYLALNKPAGVECTTDKRVKNNIIKFMGYDKRIFPIGRLDKDSQGLILMTNDGDIVNKILRAEHQHEKEYIVTVDKALNYRFLNSMEKGVKIYNPVLDEEVMTLPCKTSKITEKTFKIIITQGMNRQIRRMCEAFGFKVVELKRVRIMNILLGKLPEGEHRKLTKEELKKLKWSLDKEQAKKTIVEEQKSEKERTEKTNSDKRKSERGNGRKGNPERGKHKSSKIERVGTEQGNFERGKPEKSKTDYKKTQGKQQGKSEKSKETANLKEMRIGTKKGKALTIKSRAKQDYLDTLKKEYNKNIKR